MCKSFPSDINFNEKFSIWFLVILSLSPIQLNSRFCAVSQFPVWGVIWQKLKIYTRSFIGCVFFRCLYRLQIHGHLKDFQSLIPRSRFIRLRFVLLYYIICFIHHYLCAIVMVDVCYRINMASIPPIHAFLLFLLFSSSVCKTWRWNETWNSFGTHTHTNAYWEMSLKVIHQKSNNRTNYRINIRTKRHG